MGGGGESRPLCAGANRKKGYNMKILLSVGHSVLKTGQCTSADGRPYGGVLEYAYNKGIVEQVMKYLQSVGHEVDLIICPELRFARSADEKSYKLNYEKAGNYDLVVELHLNASALHNAVGCEVLYKSEKGKEFAQRIVGQLGKAFKNRGIQKRDNLYMLNQTKAPAVIVESFFCDSATDCAIAEKTDVALLIAKGIHGGDIKTKSSDSGGFIYRVQVGAFRNKDNANRLKKELQEKGYEAFVVATEASGLIYKVQIGAYSKKSNAIAMQNKIQTAGYAAVIIQG